MSRPLVPPDPMPLPTAPSGHEAARLAELRAFAVLDSTADVGIDDLTRLAARLCGTPLAAVSLVDAERQWFTSRHGGLTLTETPRDISFCTHTVEGLDVFEVPDAHLDSRFAVNPLVTGDPHVRFYAGAPLRTAAGHALGALCVMDHQPRALNAEQRAMLQVLGRQVIHRLEHQRIVRELERLGRERTEHLRQIREVAGTLTTTEERLAMVLAEVQAGYWDWDLDTGLVSYSARFAEMFQLPPAPQPIQALFAAVDDQELEALHAALGRLLEGRVERLRHDLRLRAGAHEPVWLRLRGQVTSWTVQGQPRRVLGLAIDISAERLKDEHLRATQKLDSIGALAAGVAHEINTPLQFVSHNLDFLAAHAATVGALADLAFVRDEFAAAIAESIDGIDRVTTIVRALKEFSHPGGAGRDPVDMNRMIEHAVTLTRNEWKFVATVERDLDPALPPVAWAAYECGQVLVNLLVNAAHAVHAAVRPGERGRITVRTRGLGGQVEIQVSDTGTGVAPGIRDRIFEPFFTTKDVGQGTGQGLATVRAIVERHGGSITLDSEYGLGSTFIVRVPAASGRRAA